MDKKLIVAMILSIIGAGIMAFLLGLSLYTIILFPAFIIVLVVNIWGGQRAKAVWLGFLAFLILTILPQIVAAFSTPIFASFFMVVALFNFLLVVLAFVLVSIPFFYHQGISRTPMRLLSILSGVFLLLSVIVSVAAKAQLIEDYYHVSEELRRYSHLNWPFIIFGTSVQVVITICISTLLFLREKYTFYIATPIFLVLNLLFAFNMILHFTNDHLYLQEITRYLTTPYRMLMEVDYFVYDIYALLALIIVFYFFKNYTEGTEKGSS